MAVSTELAGSVVHFFWGTDDLRYRADLLSGTYFVTENEQHYNDLKQILHTSEIPYWEKPIEQRIDVKAKGHMYGVEVRSRVRQLALDTQTIHDVLVSEGISGAGDAEKLAAKLADALKEN